jgi:NTP pyrophosphatase (non-canonical NTP hydrolase)
MIPSAKPTDSADVPPSAPADGALATRPLQPLVDALRAFAAERAWAPFHTPKNLASALSVEAAELLEHFQWLTAEQSQSLPADKKEQVAAEAADVFLYLLQLCDQLGIDLVAAAPRQDAGERPQVPGAAVARLGCQIHRPLTAQRLRTRVNLMARCATVRSNACVTTKTGAHHATPPRHSTRRHRSCRSPGWTAHAQAPAFPIKPIKLVIAFPAGGPTDITMRALADAASKILGQPVVVENKPGAGGTCRRRQLQTAQADGYTRGADSAGRVPPALHHQDQLGPGQGHQLRAQRHRLRLWSGGAGRLALRTWTHFVAWAKANPGKLSYGSTGTMTSPHLTMELIAQKLGLQLLHVPYKGSADLMQAILGGQIMAAADSTGFAPQVAAGKLRGAQHLGCRAAGQISRCAHAQGAGAGPGAELALWHRRTQGHTARGRQAPARCLQTGHGAGELQVTALARYDMVPMYMNSASYLKFAQDTFTKEKSPGRKAGSDAPALKQSETKPIPRRDDLGGIRRHHCSPVQHLFQ